MNNDKRFLLLCGVGFFCFLSYNQVRMPVLSLFAQHLGARPEAIGFIVGASTLTGVFLKLPSGALSDIYGRRRLLTIGLLAFALPPFLYPFITNVEVLTTMRLVHGLGTALYAPSALATVADLFATRRGEAMGWYTASTQAGALVGPVFGGWLVYWLDFSWTFSLAGVFGVIGLILVLNLHLEAPPSTNDQKHFKVVLAEMFQAVGKVLQNSIVLATAVADGAKMIAKGVLMAFLPIYGVSIGLNPGEVGFLFGIQGLTSFLAKPVMGKQSDRLGRRPLIFAGLLICAVNFALIPQVSDFGQLLFLSAFFGFGDAVITSSTSALVADASELRTFGAGMGILGTITDIGHASGPVLGGILIALSGFQAAFSTVAGIQVIAAILFLIVVNRAKRNNSHVH